MNTGIRLASEGLENRDITDEIPDVQTLKGDTHFCKVSIKQPKPIKSWSEVGFIRIKHRKVRLREEQRNSLSV